MATPTEMDKGYDPGPGRSCRLAVASVILSGLGLLLGPVCFIPGLICGHIARRAIRDDPSLWGGGIALGGLVVGYVALMLFLAFMVMLAFIGTGTVVVHVNP
jgi:hypothetical protein